MNQHALFLNMPAIDNRNSLAGILVTVPLNGAYPDVFVRLTGAGIVMKKLFWPSEQIKDASWSDDSRGKRSGFYIANCKTRICLQIAP